MVITTIIVITIIIFILITYNLINHNPRDGLKIMKKEHVKILLLKYQHAVSWAIRKGSGKALSTFFGGEHKSD